MKYLAIDIGGTWIKATVLDQHQFDRSLPSRFNDLPIQKIKSPLNAEAQIDDFISVLNELLNGFGLESAEIGGIGISTAGIVNYHGTLVQKASPHLDVLKDQKWIESLHNKIKCKTTLINDADAAAIGLTETGYLYGNKTVGIMPIGTGLGFAVWRNGRRWRPGKSLTLLGNIRTLEGTFDAITSASKLAQADQDYNLINVLKKPSFKKERDLYMQNLIKIIDSAGILYNLDEVIICGGLTDAANACNYSLEQILTDLLQENKMELTKQIRIVIPRDSYQFQLIGALALAKGESVAMQNSVTPGYEMLDTEIPYQKDIQLQKMPAQDIIETLWQAEQEAGTLLQESIPIISQIADEAFKRIQTGGRIIYVGAGTSGRIAAMDAVEIPCTYGFPEDKILTLIAGGIADASIEIESDFEEDASAVPEMLLLNIQPKDIVIGISASGTAYYVRSALAFAKDRHALSVLIQTIATNTHATLYDYIIPLNSGYEVVAGSTRMKAGTATKKVLNFLSSTIMIKLGKVAGPYMIDVACINNKLVERAQNILKMLHNIEKDEALGKLKKADMNLYQVIENIQKNDKFEE